MKKKSATSTKEQVVFDNNASAQDRLRAIEGAVGEITKRFGDGSIIKMTGSQHMHVDVIPSGSLTLDMATGVGGIPRGRITEIYGPESSGKCVTADTYVYTEYGLMTIQELFEHEGFDISDINKVESVRAGLVNERGEVEYTQAFTWNGKKVVKEIQLSSGIKLKATHNHPIRVMNDDGYIVWKKVGDIRRGDLLPVMIGQNIYGDNQMNDDDAARYGRLLAIGNVTSYSKGLGYNSAKNESSSKLTETINYLPTALVSSAISNNVAAAHITADDVDMALINTVSLDIRKSNASAQISFLRAYFDTCAKDNHAKRSDKNKVEVISTSHKQLEQIQLMLLNIGIISVVDDNIYSDDGASDYILTITGDDYHLYRKYISGNDIEDIGTETIKSNNRIIPNVSTLLNTLYGNAEIDSAIETAFSSYLGDNPSQLTYSGLGNILNLLHDQYINGSLGIAGDAAYSYLKDLSESNFYFDKVVLLQGSMQPTFDVVMPDTHSFVTNGIISHNTTVCLHVIREAQKNGGVCAFVDMEQALNPIYAQRIGVDLDRLYISQPDTGEQALEITETLVRSSGFDVIVMDSVAALVPQAEIDGDMGQAMVGLQARLMSQALRKLNGAIRHSKSIVMFTNQLREKVGVMFGSPEVTSGGRALKFYASVRLDIRRVQSIKQGEETVGNRVKIRVTKNKVAAPFRESEFDLMFEDGISKTGEIIDLGVAASIIEKRGAFFRYNNELLGQGREASKLFLKNNPMVADEIENKIRAFYSHNNDDLITAASDEEIEESTFDAPDEGGGIDMTTGEIID